MEAVLIGLLIGVVLGLTGAGGSIFAVPLLVIFLGVSVHDATGIALGAVAASAAFGVMAQRRWVLWLPAVLLAVGGAMTAPLGRWLASGVNETVLAIGFTGLACFIAIRMLRQAKVHPQQSTQVRAGHFADETADDCSLACRLSQTGQFELKPKCISGLVIGGGLVGLTSGMLGVGGGFLIIPLLLYLSRVAMSAAIATSLVVITGVSTSGFIGNLMINGLTNHQLFIQLLVSAVMGMLMSRWISRYLTGVALQRLFAVLLILVSAVMMAKTIIG